MDLGTGDGRYVLATAAADPDRLVVGIDPVAAAMAEASRRAALPARRGGLPNALFVAAAAEALPAELAGIAGRVTITLPWGSLLRAALARDAAGAAGIVGLLAAGGEVELLLAPAARDGLDPALDVRRRLDDGLAADWAAFGLELVEARPASAADIEATRSTWARRLGLRADDPDRTPFRLRLARAGDRPPRVRAARART
ncbi:MAG: class I SAM-dependent methyltransferase [Chloroflexota bacterium]